MKMNLFSRKLCMTALSLTMLASFAFARRAAAQSPASPDTVAADTAKAFRAEPGHTYWKHPSYDAVLDLWECPKQGLCMKIHSINPDDPAIRKLTAQETKKPESEVTRDDLAKMCGYQMQFSDMKHKSDGNWEGKLYIKSRNMNVKVIITPPRAGEAQLKMRGSISEGIWHVLLLGNPGDLVGRTYVLDPVPNPPAACIAPKAP